MAIVRWTPWDPQVFDDSMWNMRWDENAAVDVYEDAENVFVKIQLPGFDKKDIKVTVEGSTLTIKAEANEEQEEKNKKYYKKEIKQQSVVRSIALPTHVSSDKAKTEFNNGILTLSLPKAEEAKPKEISLS